jgi:hypothetical protein
MIFFLNFSFNFRGKDPVTKSVMRYKYNLKIEWITLMRSTIALLSTIYKIYSGVLNMRILKCLEEKHLYADEQNGFRPKRSCIDHIYSLTTIIRHTIQKKESLYTCFLDAEKAFDKIDRTLLCKKLLTLGIQGNIYKSIKEIYTNCQNCINLNGFLTDWYYSDCGVRQGDGLSPTLFGIYINDLINEVKAKGYGVSIGDEKICILAYADDVVIFSNSEHELQQMLNVVAEWGKKWRVRFSAKKSNVVHFRKKRTLATSTLFKLGDMILTRVDKYRYLGVYLSEHLEYDIMSNNLATAAGRALGSLVNKYKSIKGLGYYTFTKMYNSGICPILDYGAEIWGFRTYPCIDAIQNRAIRSFLGVHNLTPILAMNGDFGLTQSSVRRKMAMLRYWNKVQTMAPTRMVKKIFTWEKTMNTKAWADEMLQLFQVLNLESKFVNNEIVSVDQCWALLHERECQSWREAVETSPKLRTYVQFKCNYGVEPYVTNVFNRAQRSVLAKLRCGVLPLEIETGRWKGVPAEERFCTICKNALVEDEYHFVFVCEKYNDKRIAFMNVIVSKYPEFNNLDTEAKWKIIMSENLVNSTVRYIYEIYELRRNILYK